MIPLTVWGCVAVFAKGFGGFSAGEDDCSSMLYVTAFFNAAIPAVIITVFLVAIAGAKAGVVPQSFVDKIMGKEEEEFNAEGGGFA